MFQKPQHRLGLLEAVPANSTVSGLLHDQRNVDDVVLHAEPENNMPKVPLAAGKGPRDIFCTQVIEAALEKSGQFKLEK